MTKQVMVFFSSGNSAISTFTYDSTPLELVTEFKYLGITLTHDGSSSSQLLRRWQTTSGLPLPEFTEFVTARVSNKENMQCYGFSRSLLIWQLVCTVVEHGPLLLWHMIPQKSPPHMSFTWASWKDSRVLRKVLILTACSAKQVRCPFFSIGLDASYASGTV